jgi:hypothetical protein
MMCLPSSGLDGERVMTIAYSQLGEPLASEVAMALIDLAALAQKAAWAPAGQLENVANELLKRLLALCMVDRGAFLLREDHGIFGQPEPASPAVVRTNVFRALALHNMLEEDAHALLATLPTKDTLAQLTDVTCWMVYRLPLSEGRADEAQRRLGMLPGVSFDAAEQVRHALLVMGWMNEQGQERENTSLISRCSALLPLVADAAGAVMSTLLLTEHLNEIESTSARKRWRAWNC